MLRNLVVNNIKNNKDIFKNIFVATEKNLNAACVKNNYSGVTTEFIHLPHNWFLNKPLSLSVVGAPINTGQPKKGVEKAPDLFRKETNLFQDIARAGWNVVDRGNIVPSKINPEDDPVTEGGLKNSRRCADENKQLHDKVYEAAKDGHFVLNLGGDHSMAAGTVSGLIRHRPDTRIIWVDAHADINTNHTSPSGNIHGMPLGLCMHLFDWNDAPGWEWLKDVPVLPAENIVYIGLRDIDVGEKAMLRKLGVRAFSMYEIDKYGIGEVVNMAIKCVDPQKKYPLHCSFDIDSLDPIVAPSTGTPVVGGLTFREGAYLLENLAHTNRLCSLDLTEVNVDLSSKDDGVKTLDMGRRMITCAIGEQLLWGDQPHERMAIGHS
eukprot:TRINITY_DN13788_c0_g1_i1.p1 TRINITY_DN13788_c0_g1~~TRINITY_DN13788_c0_g1_i1.p1  ORF type:complete len:378 (+),score=129.24 TRINITY_DN13788_c0_g1_i1:189-1322(+)